MNTPIHSASVKARSVLFCVLAFAVAGGAVLAQNATTSPAQAARERALSAGPFRSAFVVPIKREITEITLDSVERRLERARAEQVPLIVFELDTPGGALGPTLEICNAIKRIRGEGTAVYAWVNDQAYSAGTIIALATDGIVMSANATMGDSQPIWFSEKGPAAIPDDLQAKTMSPLLEELRDSAYRNGYDVDLVVALVRPEIQIFWLENTQTGERDFVDTAGRNRLFGLTEAPQGAVEPLPDSLSKTDWRYVREHPLLGQIAQPIDSSRELLTMRDGRALAYGLSQATINSDAQLKTFLHVTGEIVRAELTWMERIVEWLASPVVRAVLFMIMLLGIYAEFHAPGVGLPGAIALGALVLFLGAPYMAGFTVTWEIVVIVIGLALLGIELFVIPGFGVVGIAGLIMLGFGLLSSFAPAEPFRRHWFDLPQMTQTYIHLRNGLIALTGGLVFALVGMAILSRYLPRSPIFNRLIGPNPTPRDVRVEDPYHGLAKVGDVGRAETLLRPAGKARFGAVLVDVVSQGEYVPNGERVEVIERSGSRVVVRKIA